jgi:transposase
MSDAATNTCPNCRGLQARIEALEASLAKMEARVARLEARNAELEARNASLESENARLRKNSSNSHKPPSSDIVKPRPPAPPRGRKRHIGGQPGHPRHERTPFAPDQIDQTREYRLDCCPDCGGPLEESCEPPRIIQQVELVEKPLVVTEHRAPKFWCVHCQKLQSAQVPPEVRAAGLAGPRLTAAVAWLKGSAHASYTTIQTFLADLLGVGLSRGELARLVKKVSRALGPIYDELENALPSQERLNVDETGHKDRGDGLWTWCFRAVLFTLFKISRSRGSKVLLETLGKDFDGVLGCDYFSAYRKFMGELGVLVQFCLAHLIRDVKFLLTLDASTRKYGQRLLERLRALFRIIHKRDTMRPDRFERALERQRRLIVHAATHPPWSTEARNMADRFRQHADSYFRFITTPGVEPTNNLAEQALRFVVIDRRITQGTRGEAGQVWCERFWTVRATCAQQGRSVFGFLHDAVTALLMSQPPPSLLPA